MRAILTYHSIDESGSPISVSPAAFEAHRRRLTSSTVRTLPLDRIRHLPESAENTVAVTFDDGFVNSRRPIELLLEAGIKPTLFVVTGHVGGTNAWGGHDQPGIPRLPLMTWDDLGHLAERGLCIESHSRTHPRLTRLSSAELDDELGGCHEELRSRLGIRSSHLAYPYGDFNARVAARAANWFSGAVTTEMAPISAASEPMMLPRLDMYYYRAARAMDSWGSAAFRARLQWIVMRRRVRAALQPRP